MNSVFLLNVLLSASLCGAGEEAPLLDRVGVVGASMSRGFDAGVILPQILDVILPQPHAIVDRSDLLFSLDPAGKGKKAIDAIKDHKPTILIALDFLFWFAYDKNPKSTDARMSSVQKGFRLLDALDCPIFLGDIPPPTGAALLKSFWSKEVPGPAAITKINALIQEMASKRQNVHMVPIAEVMRKLNEGKGISLFGKELPFTSADLLNKDGLHPNRRGIIALSLVLTENILKANPGLRKRDFLLDLEKIENHPKVARSSAGLPRQDLSMGGRITYRALKPCKGEEIRKQLLADLGLTVPGRAKRHPLDRERAASWKKSLGEDLEIEFRSVESADKIFTGSGNIGRPAPLWGEKTNPRVTVSVWIEHKTKDTSGRPGNNIHMEYSVELEAPARSGIQATEVLNQVHREVVTVLVNRLDAIARRRKVEFEPRNWPDRDEKIVRKRIGTPQSQPIQ